MMKDKRIIWAVLMVALMVGTSAICLTVDEAQGASDQYVADPSPLKFGNAQVAVELQTEDSDKGMISQYKSVTKMICTSQAMFYITEDGELYGAGLNNKTQIAPSSEGNKIISPYRIGESLGTIVDVTAYDNDTFFLNSSGELYGMGSNSSGQIGDGSTTQVTEPKRIAAGVGTISQIVCGGGSLYFITDNGELYGCGANRSGQMGDGTTNNVTTPKRSASGYGTKTKVVSNGSNTYFITSTGELYGMGYNYYRTITTPNNDVTYPMRINQDQGPAIDVFASASGLIFVTSDGKTYARGNNEYGQLGAGETTSVSSVTQVAAGLGTVVKACLGDSVSYFLTDEGELYGVGYGEKGQLGNGGTTSKQFVRIGQGLEVADMVTNTNGSLIFMTTDGGLYGCGSNSGGQLGTGDMENALTVVHASADPGNIAAICTASYTSYALTADGKLYGSGSNGYGQIGVGSTDRMLTHTRVRSCVTDDSLSASAESGETLTVSGSEIIVGGESFEAEPADGYAFVGWYSGDTPIQDGTTVSGSMTLTARFQYGVLSLDSVDIQYCVVGTGLSMSAVCSPENVAVTYSVSDLDEGLTVTVLGSTMILTAASPGTYSFTLTASANGFTSSSIEVTATAKALLVFVNTPSAGMIE